MPGSEMVDLNFDPAPEADVQMPEGYETAPELLKLLVAAGKR